MIRNSTPSLSHPTLTMTHSVRHPGRLVFPEYPDFIIKLPATAVNVLVTLFVAWARTQHLPEDERGWLNRQSAHATYQEQTRQKLTIDAVSKYVLRLIKRLEREFEVHGVAPPSLIVRDDRGTHLAREIIIKDSTGKWNPPDEARPAPRLPGPTQPGGQLNVYQQAQSTRRLQAE